MTLASRWILTGMLALLQLTAANAHVLHHALADCVSDDANRRSETACIHAGCTCCSETPPPDTHSRPPHDCQDCALCAESDAQLIRTTNAQRLVEATMVLSANVPVAILLFDSAEPCRRADSPPPSPEHLNAVKLPLLD